MKTKLAFISIFILAACGNPEKSKEVTVPSAVMEAFTKQFPGASNVKWSLESENEYEAEYEIGEIEQASNFDASGKWLVTETVVSQNDLPAAVQSSLAAAYEGFIITKAEKVETFDKGTSYEVKLKKDEKVISLDVSADGVILKKTEKEDNDDESDEDDEE